MTNAEKVTETAKVFEAVLRRKKLTKGEVAKRMGVSYPTLKTYFEDPKRMNGHRLAKLAKALKLKDREIKLICEGSMKMEEVEYLN